MAYPMIDEIAGRWLSLDGRLVGVDDPAVSGLFQPAEGQMFYEVIRITRAIPLFWEDHMARLTCIRQRQHHRFRHHCMRKASHLIAANGLTEANLRIVLTSDSMLSI